MSRRHPPFLPAVVLAGLAAAALLLFPLRAGAGWLPSDPPFASLLADPTEPRMGLTLDRGGDRIDAALGKRIPLWDTGGDGGRASIVLEGAGFMTLGRDGSFFPMRTVDGLFGLSGEWGSGRWAARLRLLHESAHRADGDTSVAYRAATYSREFAWLEGAARVHDVRVHARGGVPWHAVPSVRGAQVALGAEWRPRRGAWRPRGAVVCEHGTSRRARATVTALVGVAGGDSTELLIGVRYRRGSNPEGQYETRRSETWGIEIQFRPGDTRTTPSADGTD